MRAAILLTFLLVLPGCPTPTQYGGPIAVDTEGFAVRMAWLCRWGMQGAKASACFQELRDAGGTTETVAEQELNADAGEEQENGEPEADSGEQGAGSGELGVDKGELGTGSWEWGMAVIARGPQG